MRKKSQEVCQLYHSKYISSQQGDLCRVRLYMHAQSLKASVRRRRRQTTSRFLRHVLRVGNLTEERITEVL